MVPLLVENCQPVEFCRLEYEMMKSQSVELVSSRGFKALNNLTEEGFGKVERKLYLLKTKDRFVELNQ